MLGDRLKELRKSKNISQKKLGEILKLSQSAIGMIESNKNGASSEKLREMADFFEVTVDYLLSNDEQIDTVEEIKKERDYSLSIKDQENIDDEAKKIINELSMSFSKNKDSLSEDDYFAVETAIRTTLEAIKIKNKKKFTPKKFR